MTRRSTRSPTPRAGGTSTRCPPRAARRGRCIPSTRSSPGRSGSSVAGRSSCLSDGRLAVLHGLGEFRLGVLDPDSGELTDLDLPGYRTASGDLAVSGTAIATLAGGPRTPWSMLRVTARRRRGRAAERAAGRRCRPRLPAGRAPGAASRGQNGGVVHAIVYPPTNPGVTALRRLQPDPPASAERPPARLSGGDRHGMWTAGRAAMPRRT